MLLQDTHSWRLQEDSITYCAFNLTLLENIFLSLTPILQTDLVQQAFELLGVDGIKSAFAVAVEHFQPANFTF